MFGCYGETFFNQYITAYFDNTSDFCIPEYVWDLGAVVPLGSGFDEERSKLHYPPICLNVANGLQS